MTVLIRGGTVVNAGGRFRADVLVEGERITAVGLDLPSEGVHVIDAAGKFVLPGGIDVHTHLDMPAGAVTSIDDFHTGHVAAAFGGTTTHLDFANQSPGASLRDTLDAWLAKAHGRAVIDYGFHLAITDLTAEVWEEIPLLPSWGVSSIKLFMAYKGRLQVDDTTIFRLLRRARGCGLLTMVHAENGDVIDVLIGETVAAGALTPINHALTRPPQLEGEATGRAIAMAEVLDAPLYVVHVTCRESLSRVRGARGRGSRVWAETCPQYLYLTRDDLARDGFEGAKYVCSPPLRERADQEALWAGLRDGDLQVVSTDHCPFLYETQKTLGRDDFSLIPNGVPGIEERLSLLHEGGVNGGYLTLERFVALTSANPARLFGLEGRKGAIAPDYDADIAVWDMEADRTIALATSHSAVDYNLYEGTRVRGVPKMVLRRGQVIVHDGAFLGEAGSGRYLHRAAMGTAESRPVIV